MLAFPVVVRSNVSLAVAGGDFVKYIKRPDALTGGEVFCLDLAFGQF